VGSDYVTRFVLINKKGVVFSRMGGRPTCFPRSGGGWALPFSLIGEKREKDQNFFEKIFVKPVGEKLGRRQHNSWGGGGEVFFSTTTEKHPSQHGRQRGGGRLALFESLPVEG